MAKTDSAMKIKVDADATGVKKGMKEAEASIRSFDKTSSGALSSLAAAFGVNVGKIGEMAQAFSGAAASIASSAGATRGEIAAIGTQMSSVAPVVVGAIATITASFRTLNAQAEQYLSNIELIGLVKGSQAATDTYKASLLDTDKAGSLGQFKLALGETWQRGKAAIGALFGNMLIGDNANSLKFNAFGPGGRLVGAIADTRRQTKKAAEDAEKARGYMETIATSQMKLREAQNEVINIRADIARAAETARDTQADPKEREKALKEMEQGYARIFNLEYAEAFKIKSNYEKLNRLTTTNAAAKELELQAEAAANAIKQEYQQSRASLVRLRNSINNAGGSGGSGKGSGKTKTEEEKKGVDPQVWLQARMIEFDADIHQKISGQDAQKKLSESIQDSFKGMKPVEIDIEVRPLVKIIGEEVTDMIKDLASDTLASFGSALGGVIIGEDGAMANFGAEILNSLGAFAQKFGGLLVAMGTAGLALKDFYLNPTAAIAAGAALIIAGAAVSHMVSSLGGGSYSAASVSSGYSSGGTAYGSDMSTRELNVSVSGRLVASGSQLVAVLDGENERKNHTT